MGIIAHFLTKAYKRRIERDRGLSQNPVGEPAPEAEGGATFRGVGPGEGVGVLAEQLLSRMKSQAQQVGWGLESVSQRAKLPGAVGEEVESLGVDEVAIQGYLEVAIWVGL